MKLFTQLVPLIQLTSDKTFSFWCVQDSSLPEGIVNVNPKFAEIIDLKSGASVKTIFPLLFNYYISTKFH